MRKLQTSNKLRPAVLAINRHLPEPRTRQEAARDAARYDRDGSTDMAGSDVPDAHRPEDRKHTRQMLGHARRAIPPSGTEIICHVLDLSQPPGVCSPSLSELAQKIAARS